jgi:DNA repair protein RecN (Recombination protein N)
MIEELQIRDLGVIQEATLSFHSGLTVLTGETGAGKTMVLTALGLLLGERSDAGSIRKGSAQTSVEGRWRLTPDHEVVARATDAGALVDDGELILSRSVASDGRSRAVIGGRSVPIGLLSELGEQLVVVHGQADQIRLKSAVAQRNALDQFAGANFAELLSNYANQYQSWVAARQTLEDVRDNQAGRLREATELAENLDYLEKLAPKPNEDAELAELANRLTHTEDLRVAATVAHGALATESFDALDAIGLIGKARKALEAVLAKDSALENEVSALREIGSNLNDVAANLSGYLAGLESESGMTIDQVQERRSELSVAIKRFGGSLEDVISYQTIGQQRLLELDSSTDRIEAMEQQVKDLELEARTLATRLSEERTNSAAELSKRVSAELAGLAMAGSKLHVRVDTGETMSPTGSDSVTFLLESYAGAEPRPIGKGASGGELSRIMLAIEVVLASSAETPTFIFDEVDAGVGGATAIELGKRLATLAKNAQVIVVTHLAQVAAFGDQHLRVTKTSDAEFTSSDVQVLDELTRTEELARMLSGLSDSQAARENALELRKIAKEVNF